MLIIEVIQISRPKLNYSITGVHLDARFAITPLKPIDPPADRRTECKIVTDYFAQHLERRGICRMVRSLVKMFVILTNSLTLSKVA